MSNNASTVFREKNLQKAAGPEKLDGYLKVTGFGPWFVLLAAALVLAAIFAWVFFGRIQTTVTGAGYCENGVLRCYVAQSELGEITEETVVMIEGVQGEVTGTDASLHSASEVPNELLFLLPDERWYSTVQINCPLEDGLYTVTFYQRELAPSSFLTRGD